MVVTSLLAGCDFISKTEYASNDKLQYLKSRNGPDLVIPPPLSGSNISAFYRLPDQTQHAKVAINPPKDQSKVSQ